MNKHSIKASAQKPEAFVRFERVYLNFYIGTLIALYLCVRIERQGLPISTKMDFTGGRMQDQYLAEYQHALNDFKEKKYKKSFIKLIGISNQCSNNPDYLFLLSEVQCRLNDFICREKTLKVLCRLSSQVEHHLMYMQQLIQNNSVNTALDIGLQLQPDLLNKQQKTILFGLLSQIYIRENDFEGLNEIISAYEKADIYNDQYYFSQSLLSLNASNEQSALEQLRSAVMQNENSDQAWVALALLHEKMGDSDLSMANLEKALDVNPMNTSALKHYSNKSISVGAVDKAVEKIDFYLQQHNFDQEMTLQYAQLMKSKNKNDVVQRESEKLSYYFGQQISL